jgi:ActR/RegA family two-component response regulator
MCRVLIVDNEADVRDTLQGILEDGGHKAVAVANESEAILAAMQESFEFACIDVRLHDESKEDESGLRLALALRTLAPQMRIIVLTQYVQTRQIVRAIRYHGAVGFIDKGDVDWHRQVLTTIAETGTEETELPDGSQPDREIPAEETEPPSISQPDGESRLSLFLAPGQPVNIRARGQYVCAVRSKGVPDLSVSEYARLTEIAQANEEHKRFLVMDIGKRIWKTVFESQKEVAEAYLLSSDRGQPLLVHFETPREYLRLPLEFLYRDAAPGHIVLRHPVARFVYDAIPRQVALSPHALALMRELRVLIVASNTPEPIPIDAVDREAKELYRYLSTQQVMPVKVTYIKSEEATYSRLEYEFETERYDIIHYAGHGSFDPSSPGDSCIYLWEKENKQGDVVEMTADQLQLFLQVSPPRLVYLNCCSGMDTACEDELLDDDFLGLADAVVHAGVPSVLGFRWPVSDKGAKDFALAFYESLLGQGSPEIAAWQARRKLWRGDKDDPTWLSPILIHQQ